MLYGLFEARKLLHAEQTAKPEVAPGLVVVEGYMDVIACQRAGVAGVASMGTALTEEQMEALWKLHEEPTLCFDGDAAGKRAAARAMDRALPLLQPGRSFRFAFPEGGKDPDDVLRDQGAAALKGQLAKTQPFVQALFERERDLDPLSTPESYAGLKVRLRKLAGAIADRDLGQMYREALLDRFEELRGLSRPATTLSGAGRAMAEARWSGKPRKAARWAPPQTSRPLPVTEERTRALRSAPSLLAAAVAKGVLDHPEFVDERLESLVVQGFCDPRLEGLAHAVVTARMQAEPLDSQDLDRHLRSLGLQPEVDDIASVAAKSGAPFLEPDAAPDAARELWSQAYDHLIRITALERAFADAKTDLERDHDYPTLGRLKAERDAAQRAVRAGTLWSSEASTEGAPLH